jgi:O-antigen/teichoic acid export membrane protein
MDERSGVPGSSWARSRISTWFSPTNLSKTASLTSLASSLDHVAGITVQFVINPLLVAGLGSTLYGTWRVLFSLNGYLWAAGGRSAQALTWTIANKQRSLGPDEKRQYVGSAVVVWLIFLPFLVLVGGLASWFAPHFLNTPAEYEWEVRAAAALLACDAIALSLLSIPRSALQGENLGYKRMGLSATMILLGGGLMAVAVSLDTGIVGVAVANVATTLLTGLLFWRVARKYLPWFGIERPPRARSRWFLGLSGWFTGWKLVFELMTAGDVIVLGIFGSVEMVTVYTLTKLVSQALVPLIGIVFQGASPGLAAIIGSGNLSKAVRLRSEIMSGTWLLSTVAGASMLLWNRSFVDLWVGPQFYAGALPMLLIVVMVMQFLFIGNDARTIDLTLKVRAKVLVGAVSALSSLVLAAILVHSSENEIVALCVGMIGGRMIVTVAYPWLIGHILGRPLLAQVRGLARPLLTTAVVFGVTVWLGEHISTGSWIALVTFAGATVIAVTPVASLLGMTGDQRTALFRRARRVIQGTGGKASGPPSASSNDPSVTS